MPEWSIGAVSKTVDQLAGPRVRIPVSPPRKRELSKSSWQFPFSMLPDRTKAVGSMLVAMGFDAFIKGFNSVKNPFYN